MPGITDVIVGRYSRYLEVHYPHFTAHTIRSRKLKWLGQGYMTVKRRLGLRTLDCDLYLVCFPLHSADLGQ